MSQIRTSAVAGALTWGLATAAITPYVLGWLGLPLLLPGVVAVVACAAGVLGARGARPTQPRDDAPLVAWAAVVAGAGAWLASGSWPLLLPPGGGSDLTHHLLLVDVLDRTRHLVDGDVMGGALGEMAHYTPGLHLAIVTLGSLVGVDAWRAAHPLVLATVALKAGFVFLLAHRVLAGTRARLPLALAAVLFVLFVPRVYSLGGFLPAFVPDAAWWVLLACAAVGLAAAMRVPSARVTVWFLGALTLQALALLAVARERGAETPYIAVKMTYLAAYPLAVLAALGLGRILAAVPAPLGPVADWAAAAAVGVVGARLAAGFVVPAPVVSPDLFAAGAWARANVAPACVEYVVASRDTAYWLHLAVMGQPRASSRTAALDIYSLNAAVGRWIDGSSLPYAVAEASLLPLEVRDRAGDVRRFGTAVVIRRAPKAGDPGC